MGTLNLHKVLKDTQLDFFVMWSSWTATLGSASQSDYAASCTFMNAFDYTNRVVGRASLLSSRQLQRLHFLGRKIFVPGTKAGTGRNLEDSIVCAAGSGMDLSSESDVWTTCEISYPRRPIWRFWRQRYYVDVPIEMYAFPALTNRCYLISSSYMYSEIVTD